MIENNNNNGLGNAQDLPRVCFMQTAGSIRCNGGEVIGYESGESDDNGVPYGNTFLCDRHYHELCDRPRHTWADYLSMETRFATIVSYIKDIPPAIKTRCVYCGNCIIGVMLATNKAHRALGNTVVAHLCNYICEREYLSGTRFVDMLTVFKETIYLRAQLVVLSMFVDKANISNDHYIERMFTEKYKPVHRAMYTGN